MSTQYEKLNRVLSEIFQFDNEDLDFGIYRILNQKRDEIRNFLDIDLLPQVKEALQKYNHADHAEVRKQIDELQKQLDNAGVSYETSRKYLELKEKLNTAVNLEVVEREIYSDLANFFRRYYDKGDFLSIRRYKKDVYAVPYEGEEVKLHWANADQYYVKSSEYFKDYSFKLPSSKTVHFVLTEATTEQNNNKEQEDKERRFILSEKQPIYEQDGELYIPFEYRSEEGKITQNKLNEQAVEKLFAFENYPHWINELASLSPTEKNKKRTLLEKQLSDYTARNTFDYFIHKNLGGFLRRELDFFIKNEIMYLDDLDSDNEAKIEQYLSKIRIIKSIGQKIILFLEQIENFQKKLFLKKKFVVETNYCITLDRVIDFNPELLNDIVVNQAQIDEWKKLFAINEIEGDITQPGFSEPLSVDFLIANPYLVIDTKFFDKPFLDKLLMNIFDLDEKLDGVLVNSENFQALNLLKDRYHDKVNCVYLDPPFNLGEKADYLYKVDYKDSTWISLLQDRLLLSKILTNNSGSVFVRCSHDGNMYLRMLMNQVYGQSNYRNEIIIRRAEESKGDLNKQFETIKSITVNYDNIYWFSKNNEARYGKFLKLTTEKQGKSHWHSFWKAENRPNMRYEILGIDLSTHYGQWMWKKERAFAAVENYKKYLSESKETDETLDDYWDRTGKCLEFVNRDGNSSISSIKYWIPPREFVMADNNWLDIKGYANKWGFKTENSEPLLKRILEGVTLENDFILDFFLGSGTTVAVAHKLSRKWLGVEMGKQFDNVILPRMKCVLSGESTGISKEINWKGGGFFKYIRLESYEDTLNNLNLTRTTEQQLALDIMSNNVREEYMISYFLEVEGVDSPSFLNIKSFENPFDFKLKISEGSETKLRTIDIVETFNYLLGLTVKIVEVIHGFKIVKGILPSGEYTLIIWRNLLEKTNDDLERFFDKQGYNTIDTEFDIIYVNGDNHLENLKLDESKWKVKLIEEEFKRLMFDVQDI